MTNNRYKLGIDAGSTTLKMVVLNNLNEIVYKSYRRHKADIPRVFSDEIHEIQRKLGKSALQVCVTGSAGMGLAERIGAPFIQEVVASVELVQKCFPEVRTLLDLGGEDAKIVFFEPNKHPDIRMNGSCAGGTGAFIDQMASLLNIPIENLGIQAEKHEKIYPIASRCGVFAKTDIQNLISRNVPVPDIAASTLHAVALQTMTTLARGCDIVPPVLCVGGPLTFIAALRTAFCELFKLNPSELILPAHSEYFPAWGTALHIETESPILEATEILHSVSEKNTFRNDSLPLLFSDQTEYVQWKQARAIKKINVLPLPENSSVNCFLGIDSGSTTTKIVILDKESRILFHYYENNEGSSLKKVTEGLHLFYKEAEQKNTTVHILSSAVTGYGEDLIKSALNLDYGIVETMSHLCGAQYVNPEVSFVLDIGGQDIKSIFTQQGLISNIELNEACSAGCGSFLQNFASTMNLGLHEFAEKACLAKHPADLGSRCTVFMNSKVKQSLRENAGVEDIAAGLAYSVVKNCLFKVLKISNLNELGEHIVVQGGTFKNEAVYRALELLSGKSVSSTDHPELMGAFGAALYAHKQWKKHPKDSAFPGKNMLQSVDSIQTSQIQCKGCTNTCSIVKFKFENGNVSYAGNKCEKNLRSTTKSSIKGYNAFEEKNRILFGNKPEIKSGKARIGIPRVLNMFDNYPFWEALFTECGFEVVLSGESTFRLYQNGTGTIMSDNICFPAKLAHGHILELVRLKVDRIFYPLVPKEEKEFECTSNSFNCPVVSGYPDVIRSSIDTEVKYGIPFDSPIIGFNTDKDLKHTCWNYFQSLGIHKSSFRRAFHKAVECRNHTKKKLVNFQKELLEKAISEQEPVFIIAGRPYHADPLIHQKTGQILADLGVTVLTDDVFREDAENDYRKLNIVTQWSYPNRVVQSALRVAKLPGNVQLIQMNSFGCGPDSFFMDEASEILKKAGKNLTVIRVDEIASPGSTRLRLRSLVESLKNKSKEGIPAEKYQGYYRPFTEDDQDRTILVPWLADFLSPFIPEIGKLAGYKFVNLPRPGKSSAETGLKYGHNEVCYPSTLVLGDIINALQSGEYDPKQVAVAITQTGGQCRATNYIAQIKTGIERAGFTDIPIIAIAAGGAFQNDQKGFRVPWKKLINMVIYTLLYGDSLQQLFNAVSVREKRKGNTREVFDFYLERGCEAIRKNQPKSLLDFLEQAVADFNQIPVYEKEFEKIGLIGEIYVKYNGYAQAHISEWLREKGMEVMTPPIVDFFMQYFVNTKVNAAHGIEKIGLLEKALSPVLWHYVNKRIQAVERILKNFRYYMPSESIYVKAKYASEILSLSNQFGEGWAIAAEVAHYARHGVNKVVCIQPFGCIANHVVAKGIEKRLKRFYPDTHLLYLDIDAGIAEVNLQNRLHFMIGQ